MCVLIIIESTKKGETTTITVWSMKFITKQINNKQISSPRKFPTQIIIREINRNSFLSPIDQKTNFSFQKTKSQVKNNEDRHFFLQQFPSNQSFLTNASKIKNSINKITK
jgi:hypothetical protein